MLTSQLTMPNIYDIKIAIKKAEDRGVIYDWGSCLTFLEMNMEQTMAPFEYNVVRKIICSWYEKNKGDK